MATAIQSNGAGNTGSVPTGGGTLSVSCTLPHLTAGNMVIVSMGAVGVPGGSGHILETPVVTDSLGNTYNVAVWNNSGSNSGGSSGLALATGVTGSASTVTFTFQFTVSLGFGIGATPNYAFTVAEYAALSTPAVFATANTETFGSPGTFPVNLGFTDSNGATVTVTFGGGGGSGGPGIAAMSIMDIVAGGINHIFAVNFNSLAYATTPTVTPTGYGTFALEQTAFTPSSAPEIYYWDGAFETIPTGWLIINEPGAGLTDQTPRLFTGQGHRNDFSNELRQRGKATIHLVIHGLDPYAPTKGAPVYLFDQIPSGFILGFTGIIQDIENVYTAGNDGTHYVIITAVSWESVFDTVYARPYQYVNMDPGSIVLDLLKRYETGSGVTVITGQINTTAAALPLFVTDTGDKLSELFGQLATTAGFIWQVLISGATPYAPSFYFGAPTSTAVPSWFSGHLRSRDILWDSISWKLNGQDYRNRQAVRLSFNAFSHSMEFFVGAGQQTFTLMRAVDQGVTAYITLSTPNTATGSFSGQPANGDTVTIGPLAAARIASHIYGLGGAVVYQGLVQVVTTAGTSGSGAIGTSTGPQYGPGPTNGFNPVTGGTSTDGTVIWTCQGPSGLSTGTQTYTFVNTMDNTQFGQVLIGANSTATCVNFVNAINVLSDDGTGPPPNFYAGVTFSLPTWENSQCNAIYTSGTSFTLQQKAAGSGWIAAISTTSSNFSWSGAVTSGGTSPQGSVGPNEPATITIQVYQQGTSTAAPGVAYTRGSAIITLATPLNSGTNLNFEYTRLGGDVIEVENTALVTALAAITHGTGKVQQLTDQSSTGLIATSAAAGLQYAQELLAAYEVPPNTMIAKTYIAGLYTGMTLPVGVANPALAGNYFLGTPASPKNWIIETIEAEFVEGIDYYSGTPYLNGALNYGHYLYTLTLYDQELIDSWIAFWASGLSGSGPGNGGTGIVATSGGALSTQASQTGIVGPLTTKGDIYGYDTQADRIPVGANGYVLTADSTQALGVKWNPALTNPMTTVGDIIVGGTAGAANRLGVGTAGQVLGVSGGIPGWVSGSGGTGGTFFAITPPPLSSTLTWVNQGGATVTDQSSPTAIYLLVPASASNNNRMLVKSVPATPWTFTAGFLVDGYGSNFFGAGLILRESSTGKLITFQIGNGGIFVQYWTNNTTVSSSVLSAMPWPNPNCPILFFQITDDGTNLTFAIGTNLNASFSNALVVVGRTAFLASGANQAGIYCDSDNSKPVALTVLHWTGI
jgi:hypothetical protein